MRGKKAHAASPPPFKVGTGQSQGKMVSSTLDNAQTAAKMTSVMVASDMEPKQVFGKS